MPLTTTDAGATWTTIWAVVDPPGNVGPEHVTVHALEMITSSLDSSIRVIPSKLTSGILMTFVSTV